MRVVYGLVAGERNGLKVLVALWAVCCGMGGCWMAWNNWVENQIVITEQVDENT